MSDYSSLTASQEILLAAATLSDAIAVSAFLAKPGALPGPLGA